MSELIKQFVKRKKAWRSSQARLPMSEKVRIVEALRNRDAEFRIVRARRSLVMG
jgi:hypothetical protein